MTQNNQHPAQHLLYRFATGQTDVEESATVALHIESCESCARDFDRISLDGDSMIAWLTGRRSSPHESGEPFFERPSTDMTPAYLPPRRECPESGTYVDMPRVERQATSSAPPNDVPVSRDATGPLPAITHIGNYEIISEIARGGQGVVYKARHRRLDRIVALKTILPHSSHTPEHIARFHAEAKSAAHLDHPAIVTVFEVGEYAGRHYLVMPFIEGESLWQLVRDKPLVPQEAARIIAIVATAVQYAHERGIIHRDLKPHNIILNGAGLPCVTDFGVAKRLAADYDVTATGQIVGTPSYMPPEQALGHVADLDARSDVYALGATLYCLISGRPPFQSANALDTLKQVVEQDPPSLRSINAAAPQDLETIVLKCLRKERARRYQTAAALAADLNRFLSHEPILARQVGRFERLWRWCYRNPVAAGLVASLVGLLTVGGIGGPTWYFRERLLTRTLGAEQTAKAALQRERVVVRELTSITSLLHTSQAYSAWQDGQLQNAIQLLTQVPMEHRHWEWHYLSNLCSPQQLSVAVDAERLWGASVCEELGRVITCSEQGVVRINDLATGQVLHRLEHAGGSAWSVACCPGDSDVVAVGRSHGRIDFWSVSTGTLLKSLRVGGDDAHVNAIAFSADGSLLAFGTGAWGRNGVGGGNVLSANRAGVWDWRDGSCVWQTPALGSPVWAVASDPEGTRLILGDFEGHLQLWDQCQTAETISPAELARHDGAVTAVAFYRLGESDYVLSGAEDGVARICNLNSQKTIRRFAKPGQIKAVAISLDRSHKYVLAAGTDRRLTVWRRIDGFPWREFRGHSGAVVCIAPTVDEDTYVTAGHDGKVISWQIQERQSWNVLGDSHQDWATDVQFVPNADAFISSGRDGALHWRGIDSQEDTVIHKSNGPVWRIAVDRSGSQIAFGEVDGIVVVMQSASRRPVQRIKAHDAPVRAVAFGGPPGILATSGDDGYLRLWNRNGDGSAEGAPCAAWDLVFSPDFGTLAAGSDGLVSIFDVQQGIRVLRRLEYPGLVERVRFSPDGELLAAGGRGGLLRVWSTRDWSVIHDSPTAASNVAIAFTPDGSRIVHSDGEFMRILDVLTFRQIIESHPGQKFLHGLAFDADGAHLASCHQSGAVLLFDGKSQRDSRRRTVEE